MNTGNEKNVFLRPGELYFGQAPTRVRTILGSCVAITIWHPQLMFGGMCHYMLSNPNTPNMNQLDGRYAEDSIFMFMREIKYHNSQPSQYQVKVFGGGNMFPMLKSRNNAIGQRNLEVAQILLKQQGFRIQETHLGGIGYRRIIFNMQTGKVQVFHNPENNGKDEALVL